MARPTHSAPALNDDTLSLTLTLPKQAPPSGDGRAVRVAAAVFLVVATLGLCVVGFEHDRRITGVRQVVESDAVQAAARLQQALDEALIPLRALSRLLPVREESLGELAAGLLSGEEGSVLAVQDQGGEILTFPLGALPEPVEIKLRIAIQELERGSSTVGPVAEQLSVPYGRQGLLAVRLTQPGSGGGTSVAGLWIDSESLRRRARLDELEAQGYDSLLVTGSPTPKHLLTGSGRGALTDPVAATLYLGGEEAELLLAPRHGWPAWQRTAPGVGLAGLAALTLSLLTYGRVQRRRLRRAQPHPDPVVQDLSQRLSHEISQRRGFEKKLRHLSRYDSLTGLPNRASLIDRVQRCLDRQRHGYRWALPPAVILIDLDRFNHINDGLGHALGDEVLIQIARRIDGLVRPQDVVGRLGGDVFAILLFDVHDPALLPGIARRLIQGIAKPIFLHGSEIYTTASLGVVSCSPSDVDADDVLRHADAAMHQAKSLGGAQAVMFDPGMHERAVSQITLDASLRRAIENQQLELHYQPIVATRTGLLVGFEALVRWRHPEGGLLLPAQFLPSAESSGLIVDIDRWVLRRACTCGASWLGASLSDERSFYLSVNLSSWDLKQPDLCHFVSQTLSETGFPSAALGLEVTESMLMESEQLAHQQLHELQDMGVRILADDFGTGYSSLSYLHRLPLDTLKIDHTFVTRIGPNGENSELVRTIVALARDLGKSTVAEGPQCAEHVAILRQLDCDYTQGPFYSTPVPEAEARAMLVQPPWLAAASPQPT